MAVPYTFATATSSIPLSQLDSNFATTITLGNTAIQLGNTVTTLNNMTLANVSISSGNVTFGNVTATTANVTTANVTNLVTTTDPVITSGTANAVTYLNASKALTSGSGLTYDGSALVLTSSNISYAQFSSLSANGSRIEVKDGGSLVGYIGNGANSIGSASATQFCVNGTSNIIFGITGNAKATLSATSLSLDSTVSMTVNSGTANGVAYLNGSKVLTTGSALTFDGTTLGTNKLTTTGFATLGLGAVFTGASNNATGVGVEIGYSSGASSGLVQAFNRTSSAYVPIYYDASVQSWNISGSEQMRLTSTGLGIGTSSPTSKLTVVGTIKSASGTQSAFYLSNAAQTNGFLLGRSLASDDSQNFFIYDGVAAATRLYLDSSGNLGLGVTPSAWSLITANQIKNASFAGYLNRAYVFANSYFDGSNNRYIASDFATYYSQQSGEHQWYTAASGTAGNAITFTQAMTLDASGNLMVGRTTTSAGSSFVKAIDVQGSLSGAVYASATDGGTVTGLFAGDAFADVVYVGSTTNHPLAFLTNNTERARITSGGDLYVGTQTDLAGNTAKLQSDQQTASRGAIVAKNITSTSDNIVSWNAATSGDNIFVGFYTETAITSRGSITYNRAGGLVAYNTTSDYRAKDIIGPVANPGATIDALKVYEGKMKGATQSRPMLVAHEAQEHVPYAVTGEKDAVNEDGTPKYQQMDVSSLVPLLIAELQSLRQRVAALEAK